MGGKAIRIKKTKGNPEIQKKLSTKMNKSFNNINNTDKINKNISIVSLFKNYKR
jgi:hypothetical protein